MADRGAAIILSAFVEIRRIKTILSATYTNTMFLSVATRLT